MTGTVVKASTYATSDVAVNLYAEKAAGNFVRHPKTRMINAEGVTTGQLFYGSAANTLASLGIGSTGQALTVASGIPSWATQSSPVTFLQRQTFSAVTACDFTSGFSTAYDAYIFVMTDFYPSTNNNNLRFVCNVGAAGSWATDLSRWAGMSFFSTSGVILEGGATATSKIGVSQGNTLARSANGVLFLHTSATHAAYMSTIQYTSNTGEAAIYRSGGHATTASIVNGIRFQDNAGANINGTIAMYGIRNS